MGELIKKYGEITINGLKYDVELNGPLTNEVGGVIHIQSSNARIEMSQLDFYKLVTSCNLAKENLKRLKGDRLN